MTTPSPLKRCLCIPALTIAAIGATLATYHPTTTRPLTVSATAARSAVTPFNPVSDVFNHVAHPATVAAREAAFASQRAMNDRWAADGAKAKADSDARLAAEAEAEATRLQDLRIMNHESTSPRLGGSSGGGSQPGGELASIRACESGSNYRYNDGTFQGAYNYTPETWRAAGGSTATADQASPAEQDAVTASYIAAGNRGAWPHC